MQNSEILKKKLTWLPTLAIFLTGIAVAVACLLPLHAILKQRVDEKLDASLAIDAETIDRYVENARETALQIVSRSVIRKKLEDFDAGKCDLRALREMSIPKLMDALNAAPYVLAVRRFDARGRSVVEVVKKPYDGIVAAADSPAMNPVFQKDGRDVQTVSKLFSCNAKTCFTVTTPIKNATKRLIGTDMLLIDFDDAGRILAKNGTEAVIRTLFIRESGLFYDLATGKFMARGDENIPGPVRLQITSPSPRKKSSGHLRATTTAGEKVLLGERRLHHVDWVMICGFSEAGVYRPVYIILLKIVGFLLLVILGAVYGAQRLLKPLTGAMIVKTGQLEREIADRVADISAINGALQQEITERKQLEEVLRKSESRLKEAEKIAHLGHWELDLETDILFWSDETYKIFGLPDTGSRLPLESFTSRIHPEDRDVVLKVYNDSVKTGLPYDIAHRIVLPDGSVKYVHEQCVHEKDETGRVKKSFGTVLDVTEAKEAELLKIDAERKVMELQKKESLQNMAGAVAHHLNNAMTSIIGGIELALPAATGSHGKYLNIALQSSTKAAQLGRLLLAYLGQFDAKLVWVQLDQFWQDFRMSEFTTPPGDIAIRYEIAANLPDIRGNAELLTMLFKNLIENALEATIERPGVITVSCRSEFCMRGEDIGSRFSAVSPDDASEGAYVLISIADRGVGIDPDHVKSLMDPFFSTKFTGRGLGLAVADGIVKAHTGRMTIESEKGKGTTVTVLFKAGRESGDTCPEMDYGARPGVQEYERG